MYGKNIYGTFQFGEEVQEEENPQENIIDLMKYLPEYYRKGQNINNLMKVVGTELWGIKYSIQDMYRQFIVSTATWGLDMWEKDMGIEVDKSKPYEYRRENIKAKMRGASRTTKAMLKNVAIAFSGGEVDVIEHPPENFFEIKFIGIKGIPANMAGLINAINEIKPAHLLCSFIYTYTTCQMLLDWEMTCEQASQMTCSQLMTYQP